MARKRIAIKWIAVAALLWCPQARGQCSGYSSSSPTKIILTPAEVAAQGGMTATITGQVTNVFDANGNSLGVASHNLNATDGGTQINWNISSNNATSATLYVYANGTLIGQYPEPLNGSAGTWKLNSANLGDTYSMLFKVLNADGSQSTQDLVTLYVSSGSTPGIVSQDARPINFYAQMGSSFQGPSMMNACTLCQNQPYKCINKGHTPQQRWASVLNSNSGEQQGSGNWKVGAKACDNCAVSYSGSSPFISFSPGDQLSFNVENQVICDEFGVIYDNNGGDTFSWDTEYAFTTEATIGSMCQLIDEGLQADGTRHTGIECPVSYFCKKGSAPPDFDPAYLASDRNCAVPNHCTESDIPVFPPYWLMGGFGVRFEIFGVWSPWQFPFYDAAGFVVGLRKKSDFINALFSFGNVALPSPFGANAISCTNSALGTGPISWP